MSTLPAATHLGSSYRPTSAAGVQQSETSPSEFVVADVTARISTRCYWLTTTGVMYDSGISRNISVCHPPTVHVEFTSSGIITDNSTPSQAAVPVVDTSDPQQAAGDSESRVCRAMETAILTTLSVSEPCGVTCCRIASQNLPEE